MKFSKSQKVRQIVVKTINLHKGNQIWLGTNIQMIFNPDTTKIQPKSFRNVTNCNQSEPNGQKVNQIIPKVKQIRLCNQYWRIMEGFCGDHVRILGGAWLKYCPKGGVLQKRRFCYNNDGLLKDYMRIMMIMGGLCWDSERIVGGFSKDYVRIM